MSRRDFSIIFLLFLLVVGLCGCSMKTLIARTMEGTLKDMSKSFEQEPSVDHAREAAPTLLKFLEGIILADPYNENLLLMGAKMHAGFAVLFMDEENPLWAKILFKKGYRYARNSLDYEELNKILDTGNSKKLERLLVEEYDSDYTPHFFWLADCLAGIISKSKEDTSTVAKLACVEVILRTIIERWKRGDFYHGGPHVVLGSLKGRRFGGNLRESYKQFQEAIKIARGKFLMHYVLLAKYYAANADCWACHNHNRARVEGCAYCKSGWKEWQGPRSRECSACKGSGMVGGKECGSCGGYGYFYCKRCKGTGLELALYRESLEKVLQAPEDIDPSQMLANMVAKRRARRMLENISRTFTFPKKASEDPLRRQRKITPAEEEETLKELEGVEEGEE
ncbi:MAG: hypothetical protein D6805_04930 [Planctomycetota bacterium]|nr:MAG: hypothetical protein D6805_04930 [Planctomycetota bacterium]